MSHAKNMGPGGCVSWDDFAPWIRRVDLQLKAAYSAAEMAPELMDPLWAVLQALRAEIDAAMVVCKVEREAPQLGRIGERDV